MAINEKIDPIVVPGMIAIDPKKSDGVAMSLACQAIGKVNELVLWQNETSEALEQFLHFTEHIWGHVKQIDHKLGLECPGFDEDESEDASTINIAALKPEQVKEIGGLLKSFLEAMPGVKEMKADAIAKGHLDEDGSVTEAGKAYIKNLNKKKKS